MTGKVPVALPPRKTKTKTKIEATANVNTQAYPKVKSRPRASAPVRWTADEDARLAAAVAAQGGGRGRRWKAVAARVGTRTHAQCLQRWNKAVRPGLRKGRWSYAEDAVLVAMMEGCFEGGGGSTPGTSTTTSSSTSSSEAGYSAGATAAVLSEPFPPVAEAAAAGQGQYAEQATEHATEQAASARDRGLDPRSSSWAHIAMHIPGRTSKQCRERWFHSLDPTINRGPYTPDEDETILALADKTGNRWAEVARRLPRAVYALRAARAAGLQQQQQQLDLGLGGGSGAHTSTDTTTTTGSMMSLSSTSTNAGVSMTKSGASAVVEGSPYVGRRTSEAVKVRFKALDRHRRAGGVPGTCPQAAKAQSSARSSRTQTQTQVHSQAEAQAQRRRHTRTGEPGGREEQEQKHEHQYDDDICCGLSFTNSVPSVAASFTELLSSLPDFADLDIAFLHPVHQAPAPAPAPHYDDDNRDHHGYDGGLGQEYQGSFCGDDDKDDGGGVRDEDEDEDARLDRLIGSLMAVAGETEAQEGDKGREGESEAGGRSKRRKLRKEQPGHGIGGECDFGELLFAGSSW